MWRGDNSPSPAGGEGGGASRAVGMILVAGPCAAESRAQVRETAALLAARGDVDFFRAGVWKPRTRPGSFEGRGAPALEWLREVQDEFGLAVCVEVATPEHVAQVLAHGIRAVWIGARTTSNPFAVQALAGCLAAFQGPVFVKNPTAPDLELWIGAMERLRGAGCSQIIAVHRGFYPNPGEVLRNTPRWDLVLALRSRMPGLRIVCDPSHIAGRRDLVPQIAQRAIDFSTDGLFVEVHPRPEEALSDASQQLSPEEFGRMLQGLRCPRPHVDGPQERLRALRLEIDSLDEQLITLLAARMQVVRQIGQWKCSRNVRPFQQLRWQELLEKNVALGSSCGLDPVFVQRVCAEVHSEALRLQAEIRAGHEGEEG